MLDGKTPRQIITQRLHTVTLGSVMAGGDKADAVFPGAVEGLLGGFTSQVQIDPSGNRLVDITLTAAGAPTDSTNHLVAFAQQWFTAQHLMHMVGEIARAHAVGERAYQATGARI